MFQNRLGKKKKAFAVGTPRDPSQIDQSKSQTDHDQPILIECLEKKEKKTSVTQRYLHLSNSGMSGQSNNTARDILQMNNRKDGKNDKEIMSRVQAGKPLFQEEISEETAYLNRVENVRATL